MNISPGKESDWAKKQIVAGYHRSFARFIFYSAKIRRHSTCGAVSCPRIFSSSQCHFPCLYSFFLSTILLIWMRFFLLYFLSVLCTKDSSSLPFFEIFLGSIERKIDESNGKMITCSSLPIFFQTIQIYKRPVLLLFLIVGICFSGIRQLVN